MRKNKLFLAMGICILTLTGCGGTSSVEKDFDTTTISVAKDNSIYEVVVEEFDKDYYRVDEWKQLTDDTLLSYNQKKGVEDAVSLESYQLLEESKQLEAVFYYASASDYSDIQRKELFVGTVKEAKDAGYALDDLKCFDSESAKIVEDATEDENQRVIVLHENVDVCVNGEVLYASDNVTVKSPTIVTVGESDSYSVIVFK